MEILDDFRENKDKFKLNDIIMTAFASMILLGIGIQVAGIYSDYLLYRTVINPEITVFAYSPYKFRWIVQLIGTLGVCLSIVILSKNRWQVPKSNLHKVILLSPLLIFVLDQLVTEMQF